VTEWHINSDEPSVLDYNTNFKSPAQIEYLYSPDQYRSSDHDPVIVGLELISYDFAAFSRRLKILRNTTRRGLEAQFP
jgi:predicted extracellular nuclease